MGKRTEEKNTSKVAPAGGGDCAKLLEGEGGVEIGNCTRLVGRRFLEISENFQKESNLAVWKSGRVLNTQRQSDSNLQKDKTGRERFLNWDRRERGGMGLVY